MLTSGLGGLYQTNTKSGSGSNSNKGGSSYTSYFNGSYSYKNLVIQVYNLYTSQTGFFIVTHILDTIQASSTP